MNLFFMPVTQDTAVDLHHFHQLVESVGSAFLLPPAKQTADQNNDQNDYGICIVLESKRKHCGGDKQ